MQLRSRTRRRNAFTLIELLVVIVILGILMAVALPTYLRQQSKAKDSNAQQQLTYAYRAIRAALPEFNNTYPSVASVVSTIKQSEPELTVASGGCNGATTDKQVEVDPILTTSSKLALYTKSSSGNWWRLSASPSGAQTFTQLASCQGALAAGTVTPNGSEITDATRAASTQGDGRTGDSSYGIWTSTTNLVLNGGCESGTSQLTTSSGATTSFTSDNSIAKFGNSSCKVVVTSYSGMRTTGAAVTAGQPYSASVWVKGTPGAGLALQIVRPDFSTVVAQTTVAATGDWQYVTTSVSSAPASETEYVYVKTTVNANDTFWVDGIQFENRPVATPYVETNGSTASRSAGLVQLPATSLSATQGWYALRLRFDFPSTSVYSVNGTRMPLMWWQNGGQTNYIWLFADNNVLGFQVAGSTFSSAQQTTSWSAGTIYTLIGYWSPSTVGFSLNGSGFTTAAETSAASGLNTTMNIGTLGSSRWCDCDILWAAAGTGTLTNGDAATIYSWGNNDPTTQDFPAAAQAQYAWSADNTTYVTGN